MIIEFHLVFAGNRDRKREEQSVALCGDMVTGFEEIPEGQDQWGLLLNQPSVVEFRAQSDVPVLAAESKESEGCLVFRHFPLRVIDQASVHHPAP